VISRYLSTRNIEQPLLRPPLLELHVEVVLQGLKLVAESLATAPALEIHLQVSFVRWVPSPVALAEREVVQKDEKRSVEAVLMFSIVYSRGMHVLRKYVDVQVVHARIRMHPDTKLFQPITPWGQLGGRSVRQYCVAADLIGGAA